ncbi:GNAT family N-acetyltransferase [Vibrio fluvialis]|uniref:GNAT family N-acetyltransferase n=1 Tax=Vibrio fluvialis TaxID=676 RepID=UPI00301D1FE2
MRKIIDVIDGGEIQLRPLQSEDLIHTRVWRNREDARIWFKSTAVLTESQHRAWFQMYTGRGDDLVWVVWVNGKRVGQVSIYNIDKTVCEAEVGRFLASPDASGQGYMYRACSLLIEHCRKNLELRRIYLEVLPGNERALRLYRGLGFSVKKEDDNVIFMDLML